MLNKIPAAVSSMDDTVLNENMLTRFVQNVVFTYVIRELFDSAQLESSRIRSVTYENTGTRTDAKN